VICDMWYAIWYIICDMMWYDMWYAIWCDVCDWWLNEIYLIILLLQKYNI